MRYSTLIKYSIFGLLWGAGGIGQTALATPAMPPARAIAQTKQQKVRWQPPPPPPTLGEPRGRGQGGGSRGDCKDYRYVTPLVPRTSNGIPWGQTINDRPYLWVYAPRGFIENLPIELRLMDQQGKTIAKQSLRARATPAGVVALPFPELPSTTTYWWELSVYCDAAFPDVPIVRRGLIQRISPSSDNRDRLQQIDQSIAKSSFYAEQGLWYDALDSIGTDVSLTSSQRLGIWRELLQQADFSGFMTAPIRMILSPVSTQSGLPQSTNNSTDGLTPSHSSQG